LPGLNQNQEMIALSKDIPTSWYSDWDRRMKGNLHQRICSVKPSTCLRDIRDHPVATHWIRDGKDRAGLLEPRLDEDALGMSWFGKNPTVVLAFYKSTCVGMEQLKSSTSSCTSRSTITSLMRIPLIPTLI
jgi:hypothetical protein